LKRSRWAALTSIAGMVVLLGSCGGHKEPPFPPTPAITNLFPSNITAGSDGFVMFVQGSGFMSSSKGVSFAYWNGSPRSTTFDQVANQLVVQITQADVAAPGSVNVTVVNPGPGGISNSLSFVVEPLHAGLTLDQPTPLSPSNASAGGANFTLTVNGTGFAQGDSVTWNGAERTTTIAAMSTTVATAQITKDDIATAGTASVAVVTSNPVVGTPSTTFTITGPNNPSPNISSLSPSTVAAGSTDLQMVVKGSGFVSASVIQWNGFPRATAFVSSSQLVALIPASDLAVGATPDVSVTNPAPGGGTSSNLPFTINNPKPAISSLSPSSAISGDAAFTLTVTGTGYVQTSVVQWNGSALSTAYVSGTELQAQVPAPDIASSGTATVTVVNPTPGGGTSPNAMFTIN